jgi:hypothetical protein
MDNCVYDVSGCVEEPRPGQFVARAIAFRKWGHIAMRHAALTSVALPRRAQAEERLRSLMEDLKSIVSPESQSQGAD